jgi:transcriptional regulator with XRE-family HTH domain
LREARGWIQAKLAVEAGMAPSAVNQIENGKRSPSANSLNKLAGALGVEVADLFPKEQASLPDFGDERRDYTADELLEDFRRQVREDAKARRRVEASEGVTQTYIASHYNAAVEKLSERLPANLVGPIADILQGFARQEQKIAQLEAEVRRAAERNDDRTAQTA